MALKQSVSQQLEVLLKSAQLPPALLVLAEDNIVQQRVLKAILSKKGPKSDKHGMAISYVDCSSLDTSKLKQLLLDFRNVTVFSGPELYFVMRNISDIAAGISADLSKAIKNLPAGTHIIFIGESLGSTNPIYKLLKSRELVFSFERPKSYDLKRWVERELKSNGISKYPSNLVDFLIALDGDSLDHIHQAIEKLSLYCEGEEVTKADISSFFATRSMFSEFELIDSITSRNLQKAEFILTTLFQSGKSPFMLLALLSKIYSSLISIGYLKENGKRSPEIRAILNLSQWVMEKHLRAVEQYSQAQLQGCMQAFLNADSKLKNRSLGPELVFSELLLSITPR